MIIKNKNIVVEVGEKLIDSIKFKDQEILNTTKKWVKKFPVLFPAIGQKKSFLIGDKEYPIKRHGFWNEIDFVKRKIINTISLSGSIDRKDYPGYIEIDQYVTLNDNKIDITTMFTGSETKMQFGYHPAFNYDLGQLAYKGKAIAIDVNNKRIDMNLDINNIEELDWENIDTFILETQDIELINKKYSINISTNMKYIALWTNGDKYICIEPYSNLPGLIVKDDNIILDGNPLNMTIELKERKWN